MKSTLRASRALLTALAVALLAVVSAPVTHAQSASDRDTVVVPRITKGSYGNLTRVKRSSPEARRYFSLLASKQAPRSANCPGTACVQTANCYSTKGAPGAGCITN